MEKPTRTWEISAVVNFDIVGYLLDHPESAATPAATAAFDALCRRADSVRTPLQAAEMAAELHARGIAPYYWEIEWRAIPAFRPGRLPLAALLPRITPRQQAACRSIFGVATS